MKRQECEMKRGQRALFSLSERIKGVEDSAFRLALGKHQPGLHQRFSRNGNQGSIRKGCVLRSMNLVPTLGRYARIMVDLGEIG